MKSNDLIYRSDALDLFGHGSTYTSEEAQKMIKNLPSAENDNDYTWAKELIKRTGLSIAPEDGSKPYGYD
jgi:hypothetical protein